MRMQIVQEPIIYIMIEEIGDYYIDRLMTIKTNCCSLEEAKKEARDAGYQVIDECCHVVHTAHEVHVIVAVEPEGEEGEEVTWAEIMEKARHLALYSGTFTDNPEEKADDVYLVKDMDLVIKAFAKDIKEGRLGSYSEPASFLNAHGIEWE